MCHEKASGNVSVGIGIVIVASGSDVVGDLEVEESREVVAEEESTNIMGLVGREEARWTEMSSTGGEVAIMAREMDGRAAETGRVEEDFG